MSTHCFPQYFVVISLSDISPLKEFLICKKTHFDVVSSVSVDLFFYRFIVKSVSLRMFIKQLPKKCPAEVKVTKNLTNCVFNIRDD